MEEGHEGKEGIKGKEGGRKEERQGAKGKFERGEGEREVVEGRARGEVGGAFSKFMTYSFESSEQF